MAPLGLDGEELEGCWGWELHGKKCGGEKAVRAWRIQGVEGGPNVGKRWLAHTIAVTLEPHDPRGFLTDCSGDRRHNHGAWGLKWFLLWGYDGAVWLVALTQCC